MAGTTDKEWTVMFYFASDNPLAPLVVSQIKAIKEAGFQEDIDVLVHFDPMEKGVPTKLYNVNQKRKLHFRECWEKDGKHPRSRIGDGNDSFVHDMIDDEVDPSDIPPEMQAAMKSSATVPAEQSLREFVDFGINQHPARNYMLFLVGHGMIVGSDTFLPDDDPVSAITLKQLKEVVGRFSKNGKKLQLLSLHSCSMSSIEVAYQLRGLASYMMATQGTAFVNSWPLRQILKKTFNSVNRVKLDARKEARHIHRTADEATKRAQEELAANGAHVDVQELVEKLYFHCMFYCTDFITAGYSADLALCNLDPNKMLGIKDPLQKLIRRLKDHLSPRVSLVKDLILLAHWDAQSFWEENYTDLNDFCRCLSRRCSDRAGVAQSAGDETTAKELVAVAKDCDDVSKVLNVVKSPDRAKRFSGLVIHAENFGSEYQYASGLSIYFPWCEPLDDDPIVATSMEGQPEEPKTSGRSVSVKAKYAEYDFTVELDGDSWLSFLESYFLNTKREPPIVEDPDMYNEFRSDNKEISDATVFRLIKKAESSFNSVALKRTASEGADCKCPTIKNYPTDLNRGIKKFSITGGALRAFQTDLECEPADDDN